MKKIISLCAVIIVLAIVVTAFTACGDKTEESTTTTTKSPNLVEGISVEVGKDFAVITEEGFVVQTLKYPKDSDVKFDLEYAKKHYEFIDFNFDGVDDFYIAISVENDVISYYCWLYNETTKLYEYSKDLSALKNISVDAEKQRVISTVPNGDDDIITCYKWVDGVLTLDKSYDTSKDEVPEDVTNAESNSIGSDNKPTTDKNNKPGSDNKETTNKQSNTTETTKKPSNVTTTQAIAQDGVVLNTDSDIDDGWF